MDFRIRNISRLRNLRSTEDGLRLVAEHAPQAEALAASGIARVRPVFEHLYAVRRRIATITVGLLAVLLFVHVMFGANGMLAYRQKKAEFESLQKKIVIEQKENDLYTQRIHDLKTDAKAIEKEAREQLRYARPGELIYVPQPAPQPVGPPISHSAKK
jgi:cell division protein FtsB